MDKREIMVILPERDWMMLSDMLLQKRKKLHKGLQSKEVSDIDRILKEISRKVFLRYGVCL